MWGTWYMYIYSALNFFYLQGYVQNVIAFFLPVDEVKPLPVCFGHAQHCIGIFHNYWMCDQMN